MAPSGDFVVVWALNGDAIMLERRFANGAVREPAMRVNNTATGTRDSPATAVSDLGELVVVWRDDPEDDSVATIQAVTFNDVLDELSPGEVTLSWQPGCDQRDPDVAMAMGGDFVAVWTDGRPESEIVGGGYSVEGTTLFNLRPVNTAPAGQSQRRAAVSKNPNSDFAVVWEQGSGNDEGFDVFIKSFEANGAALLPVSGGIINHNEKAAQTLADVALRQNNTAYVTWEDDLDGDGTPEVLVRGAYIPCLGQEASCGF